LVSISIPACNAEEIIADAIRLAIAQTWHRKEIIVVDDGSRDGTAEVARRFASRETSLHGSAAVAGEGAIGAGWDRVHNPKHRRAVQTTRRTPR
jgi:glycosyltransferase involved in cell wall biosynthesis